MLIEATQVLDRRDDGRTWIAYALESGLAFLAWSPR